VSPPGRETFRGARQTAPLRSLVTLPHLLEGKANASAAKGVSPIPQHIGIGGPLKGQRQRAYLRAGKQNEHNTGEMTQPMPPRIHNAKPEGTKSGAAIQRLLWNLNKLLILVPDFDENPPQKVSPFTFAWILGLTS
jgi:hypothetical protein